MKSLLIVFALFLFISNSTFAQNENDIDSELQICLESGEELSIECYLEAEKKWDKKLNEVYQELKTLLSKESFEKLKAAQIAWIKFKEKEKENYDELALIAENSMSYNAMALSESIGFKIYKITKDRAVDLISYLELVKYYNE